MSQQAPKLVSDTHYCVVGDVSVDATAAIAPGVVLQASSGSRITIGAGVCIAAGVCVQSRRGVLAIASGVSLGANVLVVGSGDIGANACVSAGSTLINPSVSSDAILPPDTLIGESGTGVAKQSRFQENGFQSNGFQNNGSQNNGFQSNGSQNNGFQSNGSQNNGFQASRPQPTQAYSYSSFQTQHSVESVDVQSGYVAQPIDGQVAQPTYGQNTVRQNTARNEHNGAAGSSEITVRASYDRVYGREQVTKLISALFPNRQSLND